jgi:hypothetical protein
VTGPRDVKERGIASSVDQANAMASEEAISDAEPDGQLTGEDGRRVPAP